LALIAEDEKSYTVLTVIDDENSQAIYLRSKILKEDAYKGVLPFNTENRKKENLLKNLLFLLKHYSINKDI
jgi:hypothetical protein